MTIIHSIIIGIVEGITEFLPISSTAHMDITRSILSLPATEFIKSFEISIQVGAILAVLFLYAKKIFGSKIYFRNIVISFIPTAIIGFILYEIVKSLLLGNILVESIALIVGGVIIILFEMRAKPAEGSTLGTHTPASATIENLSIKQLIILGLAQALAVVPGVSRSGAIIIAGRMQKLPAPLIAEFSFLLAIPTMIAASGYDLLKTGIKFTNNEWTLLLVGFVTAFIVALFVVKWLISYIKTHNFSIFGWYRIAIGLIVLFAFWL